MEHIGKRLQEGLKQESVNLRHLSEHIQYQGKDGIDRNTLYNWFKNENLSLDKISAVVQVVPRIAQHFPELEVVDSNEQVEDDWKLKYTKLLEKYAELQNDMIQILRDR